MRKHVFVKALLACALAWMARAPEAAFARDLTATLVNKTNATISVALAVWDLYGTWPDSGVNEAIGWHIVEPGKKRTLILRGGKNWHCHNPNLYKFSFYAMSHAGGRVWAGEKKKEVPVFWVCTTNLKAPFVSYNDSFGVSGSFGSLESNELKQAPLEAGKVVAFRPFLVEENFNTTLTFTDKGVSIGNQGFANAQQEKKPAANQGKANAQQQKKPAANAGTLKFKATNKTDATISIALAQGQADSGGKTIPDSSRGWWNVKPGETKTLNYELKNRSCAIYYYAESKGGKLAWGGKSGDLAFWIHPKDAFNVAGKKISGGKQVYFRRLGYKYDNAGNPTAALNFTAKK